MLTQQEADRTPAAHGSPLLAAFTAKDPLWSRIGIGVGAMPLIVGVFYAASNDLEIPDWVIPLWYVAIGLLALSIMLSFADERWAQRGATGARVVAVVPIAIAFGGMLSAPYSPGWVALCVYGGLALVLGFGVAGVVANYRRAIRDRERTPGEVRAS